MTTHTTLKGAAIVVALLLFGLATGACFTPTDGPTPPPEPTSTLAPSYVGGHPLDVAAVERYIVEYTNRERAAEGRSPLSHDPAISDISRDHSADMAESGVFEHVIDGDGPTERALAAGYDCRAYRPDGSYNYGLGENVAFTPKVTMWEWTTTDAPVVTTWSALSFYASERSAAEAVVQMWMDSPDHYAVLMKPSYRRIGVGVQVQELQRRGYIDETVYATQNFSSCEDGD